ncbi:hypothetical protein [Microlunatus phosphovorus]|nr:hypothetical protein [Microlunatus phosphovorus]
MPDEAPTGTEKALLGLLSRPEIDAWVARVFQELTGTTPVRTLFRAGRIDAVYGVESDDGRRLVLKVRRPPVDLVARRTVADAQQALAGLVRRRLSDRHDSRTGGRRRLSR